jgi:hypothetical protein
MSLFNDKTYDYWQSHIDFIWSIKSLSIGNGLLSILDQRARRLLLIVQQLSNNPNVQISADGFTFVPASYEDIQVVAYLINGYLGTEKVNIINRNIIYLP